ncbi:DUF6412 domain-containing protein [Amycolatopsis sp. cg5]|uniref:DUF6412 domain-containing protein n=1 Tax=Amycolatopsis sp. cg5 TaxID=3238802 RepID=UPI0035236BB7
MSTLLQLAFPALTSPGALLAFASVLAASLLVVLLVSHAHGGELTLWSSPVRGRATALRERSRRAAFLRLRDPDARGRRRPRAPGPRSLAA